MKPSQLTKKESFDFPESEGSDVQVAVIVPSTRDKDKEISQSAFQKRIEETERKLSEFFGGATAVRGVGSFTSEDRGLIEEKVAVVETFTDMETYRAVDQDLEDWLMEKKQNWGQESMGFEFEEAMYFV